MKISIEGNIGCGKSSVISELNKKTRLPIFLEPVDEWSKWLHLFYADKERWGLSFNMNVLLTFNRWKNNSFKAIYERSPLSNKNVFTKLQYKSGHMTELELSLFNDLFSEISWKPDVIIYIQTPPNVCMERMTQRNRGCESNVPIEYLQQVHNEYEEMIDSAKTDKDIKHVFTVNGLQNAEHVYDDVIHILKSLQVVNHE